MAEGSNHRETALTAEVSAFLSGGAGGCFDAEPEPLRAKFNGNSRFQIVRQLGSGGFGAVFEALDLTRDETVALKAPHRPEAAELLAFKDEFRAFADIEHPNVVRLFELFEDGRNWFFSMELIQGIDFISYVRNSPERLRAAAGQLAGTLHYLHQKCNTLHRDIKPSNILVNREGKIKLLDFGLARGVLSDSTAKTQTVAGTAAYMAPELLTDRTLRPASDWYSVGAVLYEALTGQPPFQGRFLDVLVDKNREPVRPPRELNPNIPDDLNDLCLNLLERNPDLRLNGVEVSRRLEAAPAIGAIQAPQQHTPRATQFVGREAHLAALHDALQQVRRDQTVCVHIQGQSGMGKSELCKQFLSKIDEENALILTGRCYQNETVPYKALDRVVDALVTHLKRLADAEVAAVLPRERPLQALSQVFPTLRAVHTIEQTRYEQSIENSPRDLQKLAVSALKETLARIAERRLCIIFIDDFQWGDLDSVEFLTSILAPPDPPRVLFLFSYRSEDVGSSYAQHLKHFRQQQQNRELYHGIFRKLDVDRLQPEDCRRLVEQLLGSEEDGLHQRIYRESDGTPLFIHELALHAQSASAVSAGLSFPAMIGNRMALLSDSARRVVEVVSLSGRPIGIDVVLRAAGLEKTEQPSKRALERLVRFKGTSGAGMVVEPYHDKIREAVESSLPDDRRRIHFQGLANALESSENADPEIVYRYFREAGDFSKARDYLKIAAERAESTLAFDLAVKLRRELADKRNLDESERSILFERLAQALALAGHGPESAEIYKEAAQGAEPRRYQQLIRKAGEQYIRSGNFEEGQALLCALLQKVGFRLFSRRWQVVASLLARRGFLWLRGLRFTPKPDTEARAAEAERLDICRVTSLALALQDPIHAAELQARHRLRSLRLGEPYRIANSLAMEAGYRVAKGGYAAYPAALKLLDKVEKYASLSDHPNRTTLALSVRSKVAWLAGEWRESARLGEEVNRIATEQYTRVAWEAYPSSIFWMCSLACMGRWRELIARLPGLEADSNARGDLLEKTSLPVFTFAYIRWLLAHNPTAAAEELERAQAQLSKPGFIPHRFGIYYGLAEVALYMGDAEKAVRTVDQGWSELLSAMVLRLQPVRIYMLHLRARVACAKAAGSSDELTRKRCLEQAMADARRIRKERTGWGSGISGLIQASVAAEEHRLDDARMLLEKAEQACILTGMDHFVAIARYRKAPLLQGGARLEAERQAAVWFAEQNVVERERIAQMLCPGTWSSRV